MSVRPFARAFPRFCLFLRMCRWPQSVHAMLPALFVSQPPQSRGKHARRSLCILHTQVHRCGSGTALLFGSGSGGQRGQRGAAAAAGSGCGASRACRENCMENYCRARCECCFCLHDGNPEIYFCFLVCTQSEFTNQPSGGRAWPRGRRPWPQWSRGPCACAARARRPPWPRGGSPARPRPRPC